MAGILISGTMGLTRKPSEHYSGHWSYVSQHLGKLTMDLIDGLVVRPDTRHHLDISPIAEDPKYAQIAVRELAPTADRYFVIDLWSRTTSPGPASDWDSRGTPRLLDNFVSVSGAWTLYNCILSLRPRSLRSSIHPG